MRQISGLDPLHITQPVESNTVFVRMPLFLYQQLQGIADFYLWNEEKSEARFVFSFNNTREEVDRFVTHLKNML